MVGVNPEVGHEEMAGLNYAHGIAQALWHGKLFHIDLNGQHGPRYDQDLRFGAGNVRGAFWVVDTLEAGGYDGPVHFDYKPPRTEDDEGVWASAAACMRNYLILRAKVRAFRADPEVAAALRASGVDQLGSPTLDPGETWRDVREARADTDALAQRGLAYEHLDQLALEYLYGVRPLGSRGHPDAHRPAVAVVPLEVRDRDGRDRGIRGQELALRGDLDRLADAVQSDRALAEDPARPDAQVVQVHAVELVGLLEAVDQGPALDGHAAADRVHAPVRVGPARGHVQVHGDHVALVPGAMEHVVAR